MVGKLAWKLLWYKPWRTLFLILVMALAVALSVLVLSLGQGVQQGLTRATEPFTLLVGARGSSNQLVLNSVFLQDQPLGNISYTEVEKLRQNTQLVKSAIPLGFGDNYKGFRIVGTEPEIFSIKASPNSPPWLMLQDGRAFSAPYEVVLGADVAKSQGLTLGSRFHGIHGIHEKGREHVDQDYVVVGILADVGGPYNQAILTSMDSIWMSHHQNDGTKEVSAIMVEPVGYAHAMQLLAQYQKHKENQLVFPAQVIVQLLAMMGQGEKMWVPVGGILILISLLIMAMSSYLSSLQHIRQQAIMVILGASKIFLLKVSMMSQLYMVVTSAIIGWALGVGAYLLVSYTVGLKLSIQLASPLQGAPLLVILVFIALGLLIATIPAYVLQRKSIVSHV